MPVSEIGRNIDRFEAAIRRQSDLSRENLQRALSQRAALISAMESKRAAQAKLLETQEQPKTEAEVPAPPPPPKPKMTIRPINPQ